MARCRMITIVDIMSIPKSGLQEASQNLNKADISQLVEWLSLKDDNIRYQAFLVLQNRALFFDDVYSYWDMLQDKLRSDNSYQRSIGLMLIAENAKWDTENRLDDTIEECLQLLNDEKPFTIRQCIQSLGKIASAKPGLNDKIASSLISINLMDVKETMRKPTLLDILNVLCGIRKAHQTTEAESFIRHALSDDILDEKSKRQIEALFNGLYGVKAWV